MFGVLLILLLAVMGGAIAYIGDKMGTKIGKKRLSVFGLRPKHTSILITIISGILIACCTLGLLTITSRDARVALFGIEKLKKEMQQLNEEVDQKTALVNEQTAKLTATQKKYDALAKEIMKNEEDLKEVEKKLETVRAERDRQAALLNKAAGDIKRLEMIKKELDSKVDELEASRDALTAEVKTKEELAKRLQLGLETIREGDIAILAGEELARIVIRPENEAQIKQNIETLLAMSAETASVKGAKPFAENSPIIWISEEQYTELKHVLLKDKKETMITLVSAANTLRNEPVAAIFQIHENKKVFKSSDLLAEGTIDGTEPENIIEAKIFELLRKVNAQAIEKGMVPDVQGGTIGTVPIKEIYQLVDEIKKCDAVVKIKILADNDTWVADKLKIRAKVSQ